MNDDAPQPPRDPAALPLRRVSDAETLKALTHPTRLALIELLSFDGPHTATEAAERVGESPSSCSFHLRRLARYGFVEEAGGGTGRRRPWRMSRIGLSISTGDDPVAATAASALSRLLHQRWLARYETWTREDHNYPRAWRDAAINDEFGFWVTPEELESLHERLTTELHSIPRERLTDPAKRPAGSLLVELVAIGFPISPPPDAR